jgi:hypothetical protein
MVNRIPHFVVTLLLLAQTGAASADESRQLLWGDTHLHTSYSFDAFLNGNFTADPDTAYRWAKGHPVIHPYNRTRVRIGAPLDFLAVSDHAEFLGGIRDIYNEGIQVEDPGFLESIAFWYNEWQIRDAIDSGEGRSYFSSLLPVSGDPRVAAQSWTEVANVAPPGAETSRTNAWRRIGEAADAHDEPGRFTALIGWEWSAVPGGSNLHRILLTDADGEGAGQFTPYGSDSSPYPDDLWSWLEKTSTDTGVGFVSIPHNSNISKGIMFDDRTLRGDPIDAEYARIRARWETVAEVTQIKGDSETHPDLSPDDPFADFETYPYYIQQKPEPYEARPGDYLRSALKSGLAIGAKVGVNPFQLGLIGSTDAHTGLSSAEEPNFWGKMATDSVPENKVNRMIAKGPSGWSMSASGLAAVYAEENTRAAILDAFRRREVYATTGPRITVRFFGGWSFDESALQAPSVVAVGYGRGVPMGGTLPAVEGEAEGGAAPRFIVAALKDPSSANLDRIQVVKGWLGADGKTHEKVFDVAWSGERSPDAQGQLPDVGDTVDRAAGTWSDSIGAAELQAVWSDPEFDPSQSAFYYVRVLQIPTPRHSLYDAIALGLEAPTIGPSVIQERAYTSPIWYSPSAAR